MSEIRSGSQRAFPKVFEKSILRENLLNRIVNAPTGSVLIRSMAGYGKSTLLYQLAGYVKCPVVCLLGPADNSPDHFLGRLSDAVCDAVPGFDPGDAADPLYSRLSRICKVAADSAMTFIFDQCHMICDESVLALMHSLMSSAESGFKIVMASRNIPGYTVRFILEERCEVFGRDDLELSVNEIAKALEMRLGATDLKLAEELRALTGGWAAGIQFCARSINSLCEKEMDWECLLDRGLIKQYLAFDVLSELPENIMEFARRASLFNPLNTDFCDRVLDISSSQEYINYLKENEIFLYQRADGSKSVEWIRIFQTAVASLLSTKEKHSIAEKAVDYYLKYKMYAEAIDISLRLGQPSLISGMLSLYGVALLAEERFDLLGKCADNLEKCGETMDAAVCGILAQYYYYAGDYAKMEHNLNRADSMFGKENYYSTLRALYRGLLHFESDPKRYRQHVNNVLFYLDEFNLKLPFLLPREQAILNEIRCLNTDDEKINSEKPLKVTQFGIFKITMGADGREIPWRTKKGSELFAYLMSLEGGAVERSRLFDIIWKEELPNNPVAMLHNMIYNIRKELSAYKLENLVQYKNRKYSIDMTLIDNDMDAVSRVCTAVAAKDVDTLLENENVIAEYWGVFLENIDSVWVTERKDYYDKMFISGSLILADFYYDSKIYEKSLIYLQNALKVDPYSERIMEKILNCYSKMGKFDKVRARYEEFCVMLERELNIEPSEDLKSAYQRCIQRKV